MWGKLSPLGEGEDTGGRSLHPFSLTPALSRGEREADLLMFAESLARRLALDEAHLTESGAGEEESAGAPGAFATRTAEAVLDAERPRPGRGAEHCALSARSTMVRHVPLGA